MIAIGACDAAGSARRAHSPPRRSASSTRFSGVVCNPTNPPPLRLHLCSSSVTRSRRTWRTRLSGTASGSSTCGACRQRRPAREWGHWPLGWSLDVVPCLAGTLETGLMWALLQMSSRHCLGYCCRPRIGPKLRRWSTHLSHMYATSTMQQGQHGAPHQELGLLAAREAPGQVRAERRCVTVQGTCSARRCMQCKRHCVTWQSAEAEFGAAPRLRRVGFAVSALHLCSLPSRRR